MTGHGLSPVLGRREATSPLDRLPQHLPRPSDGEVRRSGARRTCPSSCVAHCAATTCGSAGRSGGAIARCAGRWPSPSNALPQLGGHLGRRILPPCSGLRATKATGIAERQPDL
jgi:hypothetical protein